MLSRESRGNIAAYSHHGATLAISTSLVVGVEVESTIGTPASLMDWDRQHQQRLSPGKCYRTCVNLQQGPQDARVKSNSSPGQKKELFVSREDVNTNSPMYQGILRK